MPCFYVPSLRLVPAPLKAQLSHLVYRVCMNRWDLLTGSFTLLLFAAASDCSRPSKDGCANDSDCKGDRLCVDGKCAAPNNTTPPAPTQSQAPAASVTASSTALGRTGPSSTPAPIVFGESPKSGTYTNGPDGTPHYILTVSVPAPGQVDGNVKMTYQNGRTEVAFTFTGVTKSTTMTATLTTSTGRTVSALYLPRARARSSFTFNDCTSYLKWAKSASECEFETRDF